jgi:hypothetical protein
MHGETGTGWFLPQRRHRRTERDGAHNEDSRFFPVDSEIARSTSKRKSKSIVEQRDDLLFFMVPRSIFSLDIPSSLILLSHSSFQSSDIPTSSSEERQFRSVCIRCPASRKESHVEKGHGNSVSMGE